MIELPEAINLSEQLNSTILGKKIQRVLPPTKPHKFCWYIDDPMDYNKKIFGSKVILSKGFGIYVEINFDNDFKLCINDGVNVRFLSKESIPKNYQLAIIFEDQSVLVFTVAMYGGICLFKNDYDNEYYIKSKNGLSPFSSEFDSYFFKTLSESKPSLSAKAFLATEQRFPGIGNGVLQDILFNAHLHPKRKIFTLNETDQKTLIKSVKSTLKKMIDLGGRDTEKNIFGEYGKYVTLMSKNSLPNKCPVCKGEITKEAYLGGSVYYCRSCQPLVK